jgi:hypothetical protein
MRNARKGAAFVVASAIIGVFALWSASAAAAAVAFSPVDVVYERGASFNSPLTTSADVDGDGRDDVVVAQGDALVVHPGAEVGLGAAIRTPFTPVAGGTGWTRAIAAGDVDGDGAAELVVAEAIGPTTAQLVLLHAEGDGTFGAATPIYGVLPANAQVSATIGDVDGDDVEDVLVTRGTGFGGTSWLLRGEGDGSLADAALLGPTGFAPKLVDVDGDGRLDLVGWDASVVTAAQLRTFVADPTVPVAPGSFAHVFSDIDDTAGLLAQVADFTGDELPDLVTQNGQRGGFARSVGAGMFSPAAPLGFGVANAQAPDVDDDGDLDPLTFDALGELRVAVNDGTGAFTLEPLAGLPKGVLITGDFDGDGSLQLAILHGLEETPTITVVTFA